MSYLHVDAVNQQFPADVSPEAMLIATKFAELLAKDDQLTRRVSRDRLETITHISDRRLAKYLIELHERKLLVMLEEPKAKRIGDKPIEYRLCLPEGLNKKVIDTRRGKYYAGKPYISRYNESFVEISAVGDRISDISAQIVMRHQSAKIADTSAKSADRSSKIAVQSAISAPINKENNASLSEYNNNESMVVDEEVEKFLEAAVQAAGGAKSSYLDLVKNSSEARIGLDAVRYFEEVVVKSGKTIRNSIGFLHHIVEKAIQDGGVTAFAGKISSPKVESESDKLIKALVDVLRKNLTREEFALLSENEKDTFARTAQKRFYVRDGDSYLQVYFEDFLSTYRGDVFASAEELLVTLDDYMNKFIAEKQDYMK